MKDRSEGTDTILLGAAVPYWKLRNCKAIEMARRDRIDPTWKLIGWVR